MPSSIHQIGAPVINVLTIQKPGTWIRADCSEQESFQIQTFLEWLAICLADAAMSLTLFQQSRSLTQPDKAQWDADREEERSAVMRLEAQVPVGRQFEEYDRIRAQAMREVREARWAAGRLPDSYAHRLPFVYARSFVTALETARKGLDSLRKMSGATTAIADIAKRLDDDLPILKHVRDSIQHGEDRVRGLNRGRLIELQPVMSGGIHAPDAGVLIYDHLSNDTFGTTLADGTFGEVDITFTTARRLADAIQESLDSFEWHGPPEFWPR